jgi:PAS domain-containing protein
MRPDAMFEEQAPPPIDAMPDAKRPAADLMVVLCLNPRKTCAQSEVLMARLRPCGIFELLTSSAWAHALGYHRPEELRGKSLGELMPLDKPAAGEIVAALLDTSAVEPLDVPLRCKDDRRKYFRFHRRFDAHGQSIFVVADELPVARD